VMYAGNIVETGTCRDVIRSPAHPYMRGLLASRAAGSHMKGERLAAIPGAPPDLANLPAGCAFAPRCREMQPICQREVPPDVSVGRGHSARCLLLSAPVAAD
jgi:peptide/nickel transport system ATP-binding protein